MNVVFVNSTRKWGGVKTWSLDMAECLIDKGHGAWIIGRPGPFVDKAKKLGIPAQAHSFGFDMNPVSVLFFYRFLKSVRADVLIANISKDLRTAGIAAKMLGIPVVHRLGAPGDIVNSAKTRLTQRFFSSHIMACSDFVRNRLTKSIPLLGEYDFVTIHPGTRVDADLDMHVNRPKVIIATSQLNEDKRHVDLLEALARLKARGIDFRCIIAGTGRIEDMLKARCTELGLDDCVEWTGFVTNIQDHLKRADIFVLPTRSEPLGISLEEAMAQGLIPIARRAGGVPEIWPAAVQDMLVEPSDAVNGFEHALESLITMDDEAFLAKRREVHRHAMASFERRGQADKFIAWLQKFIMGK